MCRYGLMHTHYIFKRLNILALRDIGAHNFGVLKIWFVKIYAQIAMSVFAIM